MLYPALGMLDATNVSVGRGTATPFEVFGAGATDATKDSPALAAWFNGKAVAAYLTARKIPGVSFAAATFTVADDANQYPYHGQTIQGVRLTVTDRATLDSPELGIEILSALHHLYPRSSSWTRPPRWWRTPRRWQPSRAATIRAPLPQVGPLPWPISRTARKISDLSLKLAASARTKTKYGDSFPSPSTALRVRVRMTSKAARVPSRLLCHHLFTQRFHNCVTIEVVVFSDQESSIMPRINFHLQLAELKDKLLAMAALSQQALDFSVEGYIERDMALCSHVLEIEEAINTAETVVDEMAYELLAKEQPMAIDLRFILSVIKINGDLERIGDQAANIAERALALKDEPVLHLPAEIQEMGERAGVMIRSAIQALLEADPKMADSVLSMDDAVDARQQGGAG